MMVKQLSLVLSKGKHSVDRLFLIASQKVFALLKKELLEYNEVLPQAVFSQMSN